MKYSQWIGLAMCALCVYAGCYMAWASLGNEVWTGLQAGKAFRAPGKFHIFLCSIAALLFLIPKTIAKQINLVFVTMNLAWAFRNFLGMWRSNDVPPPHLHFGLYLLVASALGMVICNLLAKVKVKSSF
jgi:hypothetical protein